MDAAKTGSGNHHALSRQPDKLAFVVSAAKCVFIPVGLYSSFSSLLFDDNILVTHSVACMKCLVIVNFVVWAAISALMWARPPITSFGAQKKSRIRIGAMIKCLIYMFLTTSLLHVFIVLFGAALTVDVAETFYLAALTSSLAIWPCIFVHGVQWDRWLSTIFVFELSPMTGIEGSLSLGGKGALIGLWLGAVPIPLDWDRPWQRWPVTCVVGALVGHAVGLVCHVVATLRILKRDSKRNKIV